MESSRASVSTRKGHGLMTLVLWLDYCNIDFLAGAGSQSLVLRAGEDPQWAGQVGASQETRRRSGTVVIDRLMDTVSELIGGY